MDQWHTTPCYLWNTVLLLRSEVDKFIYSIARGSCGGALSTECSVALSTEALRCGRGVDVIKAHSCDNQQTNIPGVDFEYTNPE